MFPWDRHIDFKKGSELDFDALDGFIEECRADGVPFCVFVASFEPHSAWNKGDASQFDPESVKLPPPMYVDIPETWQAFVRYLAEINHMDAQVGRVMDILDRRGVADNSAMVFTSEQGNSFPFAKWTCYDQGVHTAFVVRWQGVVRPGSRSDALVEYIDLVPTFLDMAGAEPRGPLDGRSIVPLLEGRRDEHKTYTYSQHTSKRYHRRAGVLRDALGGRPEVPLHHQLHTRGAVQKHRDQRKTLQAMVCIEIMRFLGYDISFVRRGERRVTSSEFESAVNKALTADKTSSPAITHESSLALTAVWACVRILSETVGTLPIHLYRRTDTGRERQHGHAAGQILLTPNSFSTRLDLMHFR